MKSKELSIKRQRLLSKIGQAEYRLEQAQSDLADCYLNDTDAGRINADVIAAQIDLQALKSALVSIDAQIVEADKLAFEKRADASIKEIRKLSGEYDKHLNKAEEFCRIMMMELNNAALTLGEIQAASDLNGADFQNLRLALREANGPVAVAMATLIASENRIFAETLGSALCNHKDASLQCAGRSVSEMAISPIGLVA